MDSQTGGGSATNTIPATMRAIVQHEFGGPSVLRLETVPVPRPSAGEVLVRVRAASINPIDEKTRQGKGVLPPDDPSHFPFIPGWDLAGDVVAAGVGVDQLRPGEPVFGMVRFPRLAGTYAEYVAVPAGEITRKPGTVSYAVAAAASLAGLTAWQALFEHGGLAEGETVLIQGGSGGVGHLAVQLAKWRGATVIATASAAHQALLRELGVDRPVDYRAEDIAGTVKDVDLVLDTLGHGPWPKLRAGGRVVSLAGQPHVPADRGEHVTVTGMRVHPDPGQLDQLAALLAAGTVRPRIAASYPLADAAAAHAASEKSRRPGKVVLTVD